MSAFLSIHFSIHHSFQSLSPLFLPSLSLFLSFLPSISLFLPTFLPSSLSTARSLYASIPLPLPFLPSLSPSHPPSPFRFPTLSLLPPILIFRPSLFPSPDSSSPHSFFYTFIFTLSHSLPFFLRSYPPFPYLPSHQYFPIHLPFSLSLTFPFPPLFHSLFTSFTPS